MMEKIIRSMFRGSLKTKVFLWSVFILGLAAVCMFTIAVTMGIPAIGAGALGLGLVSFMVSQSVSIDSLEKKKKVKKEREQQEQSPWQTDPREREKAKARYLASMSEKQLKKVMKEHKVKQSHVKVMIDSYPDRFLNQVPAFMWRTDTALHFLVLEGRANEFEVPIDSIRGILLEKNVAANPDKDYMAFRYGTFIGKLFTPYLPEYFERSQDGKLSYQKNLFCIEPGIYFTNSSVANLMEILRHVPFLVDDEVCRSDRFDEFFKELYRYSILCKNMVITLEQYRAQVEKTLDALLGAPITGREFVNSLKAMSRYRLINHENVVQYTQKYQEAMHMNK